MLAALGAIVMLSGMYAFFALRTSLTMVAVLMVMHLAIAVVTYNALVYLAPATRRSRRSDIPAPG